jgi:hypothetical protein
MEGFEMLHKKYSMAGLGLALVALLWTVTWSPAQAGEGETLTNVGVMQLCELGLGDEVVIAKIKQAEAVAFKLEIDDLAQLKSAGVSGPVIAAMLERTTAPPASVVAVGGLVGEDVSRPEVVLKSAGGEVELTGMYGHYSMTHAFITVLAFMNYEGLHAAVRTTDVRPAFLVACDKNPRGIFYLVKAEVDDDDGIRSVKAGQMSMYNMQSILKPDEDWTLDYEAEQLESGLWKLTPAKDLPPGEYGVWKAAGSDPTAMNAYLFDFGVDK